MQPIITGKSRIVKIVEIIFFCVVIGRFYKCPIKAVFGIDCPGCGMTRAFISFFKLDISSAFSHQPLFPVFGILLLYTFYRIVFPDKKRLSDKCELIIVSAALFALIVVYMIKKI